MLKVIKRVNKGESRGDWSDPHVSAAVRGPRN